MAPCMVYATTPQSHLSGAVGASAVISTSFMTIPQIIHCVKTRSAKDISLAAIMIGSLSTVLWEVYGVLITDYVQIIGNIVLLSSNLVLLYLKYHFSKGEYENFISGSSSPQTVDSEYSRARDGSHYQATDDPSLRWKLNVDPP